MKPMRLFAVSDKFKPWGIFILVYLIAAGLWYAIEEMVVYLFGTNYFMKLISFLTLALAVIPLFYVLRKRLPDLENALHFYPVKFLMGLAWLIVIIFIGLIMNPDALESPWGSFAHKPLDAFLMALAIPVLEEMFFRGILLALFIKYYGKSLGIIFSSVCFSLVHLAPGPELLLVLLTTLSVGLVMAYATIKTKNLSYAMGFHVAWNLGFLLGL